MPIYHNLRCCCLPKEEEWKAKALLYETYCEEMGWFPSPNNSSELRIEDHEGTKILEDKFSQVSVWMGVFDAQNNLVGCAKVSGIHPATRQLDMMEYMPERSKFVFEDRGLLCEASRLAVRKAYRYKGLLFLMLFKMGIQVARANRATCFIANAGRSFDIIEKYVTNTKVEFKYEERDPNPVTLSVVYLEDMEKMLEDISRDISSIVEHELRRDDIWTHARL